MTKARRDANAEKGSTHELRQTQEAVPYFASDHVKHAFKFNQVACIVELGLLGRRICDGWIEAKLRWALHLHIWLRGIESNCENLCAILQRPSLELKDWVDFPASLVIDGESELTGSGSNNSNDSVLVSIIQVSKQRQWDGAGSVIGLQSLDACPYFGLLPHLAETPDILLEPPRITDRKLQTAFVLGRLGPYPLTPRSYLTDGMIETRPKGLETIADLETPRDCRHFLKNLKPERVSREGGVVFSDDAVWLSFPVSEYLEFEGFYLLACPDEFRSAAVEGSGHLRTLPRAT